MLGDKLMNGSFHHQR